MMGCEHGHQHSFAIRFISASALRCGRLYFHLPAWSLAGLGFPIALCVVLGATIGALAFRYGVAGVLLYLAATSLAEFSRIGLDHFAWLGGSGGMFLKLPRRPHRPAQSARHAGDVLYVILRSRGGLGFERLAFAQPRRLLLAAIRENEDADQALGIIPSLECSLSHQRRDDSACRRFSAFYYGSLSPSSYSASTARSKLFGRSSVALARSSSYRGAAASHPAHRGTSEIVVAFGASAGIKQLISASCYLRHRLFAHGSGRWRAALRCMKEFSVECAKAQQILSRLRAEQTSSFEVEEGAFVASSVQRRAKTTIFTWSPAAPARRRSDSLRRQPIDGLRRRQICVLASAALFRS